MLRSRWGVRKSQALSTSQARLMHPHAACPGPAHRCPGLAPVEGAPPVTNVVSKPSRKTLPMCFNRTAWRTRRARQSLMSLLAEQGGKVTGEMK